MSWKVKMFQHDNKGNVTFKGEGCTGEFETFEEAKLFAELGDMLFEWEAPTQFYIVSTP